MTKYTVKIRQLHEYLGSEIAKLQKKKKKSFLQPVLSLEKVVASTLQRTRNFETFPHPLNVPSLQFTLHAYPALFSKK